MELDEFTAFHGPARETNPARHNLILGLLERAKASSAPDIALWSLERPGACAIRTPRVGRGVLLGEVTESEARALARAMAGADYPTVQGPDDTAKWFAAEAETLGARFEPAERLRILALSRPPSRPDVPGAARVVAPEDAELLMEFSIAFIRDAGLRDPNPTPEHIAGLIPQRRHFLWEVDGTPVAVAGVRRQMRGCGSIAPVYTVPEHRGRGFGGAVTAHAVDQIHASGRETACLYADAANPASNRCYEKLGFAWVCDCLVIPKA